VVSALRVDRSRPLATAQASCEWHAPGTGGVDYPTTTTL
jgi:hypothetical protein